MPIAGGSVIASDWSPLEKASPLRSFVVEPMQYGRLFLVGMPRISYRRPALKG